MVRGILWGLGWMTLLTVLSIGGGFLYLLHQQSENKKAFAITAPGGINEAMYVKVGGIDQWITIRGENRDNPVILMVHGGPGGASSGLVAWFKSWEQSFTLVQWDQRGAGRSYSKLRDATPDMTLDRIIADGIEVSEYVRDRLHKDKIILLGHSWGSVVGLSMAAKRPELYAAYAGTGQIVDYAAREAMYYAWVLEHAKAAGKATEIAELERIGPPPYPYESGVIKQRIANAYASQADRELFPKLIMAAVFAPDTTLKSFSDVGKSMTFSARALYPNFQRFDAKSLGSEIKVPIFMFQGDADYQTPTVLIEAYLAGITAPSKQIVLLKNGGHTALLTSPDLFLKELVARVRPLAVETSAVSIDN